MENAAYLQNMEEVENNNSTTHIDENMDTFEVDSIELKTPELFSDEYDQNSFNQDNENNKEPEMFEGLKAEENENNEPEMFEETNQEEDFEIPAFLRRQKN